MADEQPYGERWESALMRVAPRPLPIDSGGVPAEPGVYIWFRDGKPIYVGKARGAEGLRQRLRAHFSSSPDLSRSTLRASVAVAQLGVTRLVARQRPSVMAPEQVAVVNRWLAECEVGWIVCDSAVAASHLEEELRGEWLPRLNLV